jgi:NitT/TauT family transport system substrate-binding protein
MSEESTGLTGLGKLLSFLLVIGLVGLGAYVVLEKNKHTVPATPAAPNNGGTAGGQQVATPATPVADNFEAKELVDTKTSVDQLPLPGVYEPQGDTIEVELSHYAGYAGLIAANGGLDANPDSVFYKKHHFKVKLTLNEDEASGRLNEGKMAASATTADVLAVWGKQYNVMVPAQIGFSRGADGIVVRSEIKRINQLKGKVLAAIQFYESDFLIRYLAQTAGLQINLLPDLKSTPDPDKINLVYCGDGLASGDLFLRDLNGGTHHLDGCVTWEPKTTEVAAGSNGKAYILTTNRNLLIIADILVVNKGFATAHPDMVAGLVDGLIAGNAMMHDKPEDHLPVVAKAFGWDVSKTRGEMAKVHLANLPENLAFFSGSIDSAGSFGGIYQSSVLAYGSDLIKNPVDAEHFFDLTALKAADASGDYKDQKIDIAPIRSTGAAPVENDPLLSKNIRFLFEPNSSKLDLAKQENNDNLESIKELLKISPGSTVLLRGHVDNAQIENFRQKGGDELVHQMALKAVELSKDRANEIKRLLVDQHGIDSARIETVGRGWEEPLGTDSDQNRRVEVQWFTIE